LQSSPNAQHGDKIENDEDVLLRVESHAHIDLFGGLHRQLLVKEGDRKLMNDPVGLHEGSQGDQS